jgi:aspartyl aminopeptidase
MRQTEYISNLIDYLISSPTAFHAVSSAARLLADNNFNQLYEEQTWNRLPAGKYFVIRNDSSLIAFTWAGRKGTTVLNMIGAHTDSPCLKVKPAPVQENNNCLQLAVEVYGSALTATWFDRDLSLAGRVCWYDDDDKLQSALVNFKRPIGIIPSLAIHLNREADKKLEINKQNDLVPVIGLTDDLQDDFQKMLQEQVRSEHSPAADPDITDHELFFYDVNPPILTGLGKEFITGARLDNLLSCFAALLALSDADSDNNSMIILNDHEEVGSISAAGARGSFLANILERLLPEPDIRQSSLRNSLLISADNAHAVHPNFAGKHDPDHLPLMGHGPVIKLNANQRYATNAKTAGRFRMLCRRADVPVQEFVMRNDMACGSTIGPLAAAQIGVETVDVGIPSLAMHSIREMAAAKDCWYLYRVLQTFFSHI